MNELFEADIADIKEEITPYSLKDNIYYVGESYSISYVITKKRPNKISISLETEYKDEIELKNNSEIAVTIIFEPTSIGQKSFQLLVKARSTTQVLLERTFNVKAKSVEIAAEIEKQLPKVMKLGQTAEVIFLFTNKGNQAITGINIEVNQIEEKQLARQE